MSANTLAMKSEIDTRKKFKDFVDSKGTKYSWIADQTGLSKSHISNVFAQRVALTEDVRTKLNNALGTNF